MVRCLENRALVIGRRQEPELQKGSVLQGQLELWRYNEIGAKETTVKFGHEVFLAHSVRPTEVL